MSLTEQTTLGECVNTPSGWDQCKVQIKNAGRCCANKLPLSKIQRNYTNSLKKLTVYLRRKMHG